MRIRRAYRLKTHTELFSFGDPIGHVPILEKPLQQWQLEATEAAGLEVVDIADPSEIADDYSILFENHLFFSPRFCKKAVGLANKIGSPTRFAVADNRFNRRFALPTGANGDRTYPFYLHVRGAEQTSHTTVVPQNEVPGEMRLPRQLIKGGVYEYYQSGTYITAFISPFHVLAANLAMHFERMGGLRRYVPIGLFQRLLPERSARYCRALRLSNRIGKGCNIHPTAVLEGAVLGDHVTIGANTVVRLSHIGDHCLIEDNTTVQNSVLNARTCVSPNNLILTAMCYDEVYLIHGPYQFSIFGRNSAVFGTINCDFRLDQATHRIQTENGLIDSGQPLLGVAYGHRAKVAGGNIIAPGRIVPNDYFVSSPDSIVSTFPPHRDGNRNKEAINWY